MQREDLQVFIDTGLPFVVLDNSFQDSDVDSVSINNFQGISKAMQYAYDTFFIFDTELCTQVTIRYIMPGVNSFFTKFLTLSLLLLLVFICIFSIFYAFFTVKSV